MLDAFRSESVSRRMRQLRLLVLLPMLGVAACGGGNSDISTVESSVSDSPYISATLVSFPSAAVPAGFVPSGFDSSASVEVLDAGDGTPITNATVSMQGVTLAYNSTNGAYEGSLVVAPGDSISLVVSVGGKSYTATTSQFNAYPAIATPSAAVDTWYLDDNNWIVWSGGAPTAKAAYFLGVADAADINGQLVYPAGNVLQALPIVTTSSYVPAGSLTPGNRLVMVGIATIADIANAHADSGMVVAAFTSAPVSVKKRASVVLSSITVTPANQVFATGGTQQFAAKATYSDNTTADVTYSARWTSSDPAKVTISSVTGVATATGVGPVTITATLEAVAGSAVVNVVPGFAPAANYPPSSYVFLGDTAVGDLNGDGRNDVAVRELAGARILVYYQNAAGTLDSPLEITSDLSLKGLAIADVNNDGLADLIASGNSTTATTGFLGRIAVFRQDSLTHALGAPQEYVISTSNVGPLAVADLNGDSLPDIVSAGSGSGANGVISLLLQEGGGVLGPEVVYGSVPVVVDGELHVADMNHDGANDIVVQSGDKQLAVVYQISAGTFTDTPDYYTVQTNYWPYFRSFALADLNGDGRTDAVVADLTGNLNVFYQDSNGSLAGNTISGYWADEVEVADIDGDGLNDIVLLNGGNWVRVLYQLPDHSLSNPTGYTLPTLSSGGTPVHQALSVGDLTGDGLPDVITSWTSDGIYVMPRVP